MLYLATPSGPDVRTAMCAGLLGCITTPAQDNLIPAGYLWAADNGKFGRGRPGSDVWSRWLAQQIERYDGPERCLWAVAPDVPCDAEQTLIESRPWLPRIRDLGVPAAFAAQDGCEHGLVPWNDIDVLFLAGSTAWKLGPAAEGLAREAAARGKGIHMGRVNSRKRLAIAQWYGCDSVDGTYLTFGPATNLSRLRGWLTDLDQQPAPLPSCAVPAATSRHDEPPLPATRFSP